MGILIITIVLLVVGLVLAFRGGDLCNDGMLLLGAIFSVCSGVAVFIMLICATELPSHFEYAVARYNNLKSQIESIERDDIITGENLRNQVLEMNNEISKHRCYSKNFWIGMWYSEKVGSLEPLEWKSAKGKEDVK